MFFADSVGGLGTPAKIGLHGVMLFVVAAVLFFAFAHSVYAVTWDNGGGDGLWSTCTNWTTDACPSASVIATFDSTSTANVAIDANISVIGIDINSGYTGTITQNSGVTVTVGASDFDISDGTFTGGNAAMTVNDAFTVSGGIFTATTATLTVTGAFTVSSGTFNESTGTVAATAGTSAVWNVVTSEQFNNLTINKTGSANVTITSGDTLVVTGTLTLTDGNVNTGTVDTRGAISQASTFDGGTAVIDFGDDSGADTYTINGGIAPTIRFDSSADASDSLTFAAAGTVTSLSITSGFSGTIPISNGSNFTLTFTTWTQDAGTIDASAQSAWTFGTFTISAGSFTAPTTTTAGQNSNIIWNVATSQTFNNFTISKSNVNSFTITSGDTLVVTGTLTLTEGAVNTGTIDARGAISQASTFDGGTAVIDFGDDSGADTYTINGGTAPTIRFDSAADASDSLTFAAAGTVTSLSITSGFSGTIPISNGSNFTLTFTTWTQDAGTIDASAQSAWNLGTFTRSAGSFTAPTTVTSNGNNVTWNVPTSQTFNNLTRSGGNATTLTITSGDTLVVTGTLTLTEGAVGTGTLEAQGGVTVGSGYDGGNSPLTFSGSATQSFDLTGATGLYNSDISVNKSGGQVNLASALVMDAANQDLTIIEGKLYTGGNNLTVNGTSGTFTVQDGGNFQLQGAETITLNASNPTLDTGSTVTYVGNGNAGANTYTITTLKSTYHHLVINSTDGATDVYQLGAALDVNGDLTITAGNLDVVSGSNRAITLAGNWSNSGTFSAQAGTVTLDGTDQSVSGTTSFFNFTKTVATAATLTFAASATQTFTGTLTLQGNSTTDRLALRSSSSPTRAIIDPQSTRTVDFLDVKDINNTNATAITCETPNCFDSGNNLNWNFGGVAQTLSFSISDNTIGFGALSPSAARYATGDTNGSSSDTADAHTLSASTNAGSGYVITVNGATLTHTGNPSYTVTAIGSSATASSAGTEQFGMRLAVNSGSGSATSPYASANWALDTAAFPDQVASGTGDDVTTVYGVRYIGNITTATEAGNYSATLTYTITATF